MRDRFLRQIAAPLDCCRARSTYEVLPSIKDEYQECRMAELPDCCHLGACASPGALSPLSQVKLRSGG